MESSNPPPTEIEKLWHSLSSENQEILLQKFVESSKNHAAPASPIRGSSDAVGKRALQSPETPYKGRSRKVCILHNISTELTRFILQVLFLIGR